MGKSDSPKRSQPTRDRILDAARSLFGEVGFERCTVRAVAAAAGIHPSLVMRYFTDKEGLFAAAVRFDLRFPDLSTIPPNQRGQAMAEHFISRWEGSHAGTELPALLRIAVTHPRGRDQLFEIFREQVAPSVYKLVSPERAPLCSALIATQAIGLAFTRYVIKLPVVVALSATQLVEHIGATFQGYLDVH